MSAQADEVQSMAMPVTNNDRGTGNVVGRMTDSLPMSRANPTPSDWDIATMERAWITQSPASFEGIDGLLYEAQLVDHRRGQDEWVAVGQSEAPIEIVQYVGQ